MIGDAYGALTIGAAAIGATGIRVFQDSIMGERALAANAAGAVDYVSLPSAPTWCARRTRRALMQLPRSLAELDELAAWIASAADPAVRVYAGGRIKHMTTAMNEVLARHFGRVDVTYAVRSRAC